MHNINIMGFGTILYGSRSKNKEDNSYIATRWITLFYLPIIPLGSYRVILGNQRGIIVGAQVGYQSTERIKLDSKQVVNTYLLWYLPILAIVVFFVWLSSIPA